MITFCVAMSYAFGSFLMTEARDRLGKDDQQDRHAKYFYWFGFAVSAVSVYSMCKIITEIGFGI